MIGPGPRLKTLLSLVSVWGANAELVKKFNRFSIKVEGLGARRNRYAHDTVHQSLINGYLVRAEITANKKLRFENERVDPRVMHDLWIEIRMTRGVLIELRDELIDALPAWTNKHRARYVPKKPHRKRD
jgi:hypothetical protein